MDAEAAEGSDAGSVPEQDEGLGPCVEDCGRQGVHFHGRCSSDPCCGQHKDCGEWMDQDGDEPDRDGAPDAPPSG
ncbi:MAG: hypothetical protein QOI63_738, partial [Thermoplasmata archaeon]|nr:hypothetical protein [Thermoplasmata archaeon]